MKFLTPNRSLYGKIIVSGIIVSVISVVLLQINRLNYQKQNRAFANAEAAIRFAQIQTLGGMHAQSIVLDLSRSLAYQLQNGMDIDKALKRSFSEHTSGESTFFSWCLINDSLLASNPNSRLEIETLRRIAGADSINGSRTLGVVDGILHVFGVRRMKEEGKQFGSLVLILGFPARELYSIVDPDRRILEFYPPGDKALAADDGSQTAFVLRDFKGDAAGRVVIRDRLSGIQTDFAGWELIGLAILPALCLIIFWYISRRHYESLVMHLKILRRILKPEKPGVEIFRRDQQMVKSSVPELSDIFEIVDDNQGERLRLTRSLDMIAATLNLVRGKGYSQEIISEIIEIIAGANDLSGGLVLTIEPSDDKFDLSGSFNIPGDVVSNLSQTATEHSLVIACRKDISRIRHYSLETEHTDEPWAEYFKNYKQLFLVPLSFRSQFLGSLVLVSTGGNLQARLQDGFMGLAFNLLGTLIYGISLEKEKLARYDKIKILQETSLAISSTLDLPSVLQIVTTRLSEYADVTYCMILLNTEIENTMEVASYHAKRQNSIDTLESGRIDLADFPHLAEAVAARRRLTLAAADIGDLTEQESRFFGLDTVRLLTILPISHSANSIGVVVLGEERARSRTAVGPERLDFIQAMVSQAASAIENARLYGYINQRVDQLTVLYNASAAIHSDINITSMLDKVLSAVAEFLPYAAAAVYPVDEKGILMPPLVSNGQDLGSASDHIPETVSMTAVHKAASTGEIIIIDDTRVEPDFHPTFAGSLSELSVPIVINERIIGVISVGSTVKSAYNKVAANFLKTVAGQIAVAMERARLFEQERKRGLKLRTIFEFSRKLSRSLNVQEVLRLATTSIIEAFGYHFVSVFMIDHMSRQFYIGHQTSAGDKKLPDDFIVPLGEGFLGRVHQTCRTVYCADVKADPTYIPAVGDVRSEVCIPIVMTERVIGVLDVESMRLNDFTSEDIGTLEALADIMAVAIDNSYLFEETIEKAERLSLIDNINRAISATLDLDSFFRVVARAVADNANYRWTSLVVPENGSFVFKAGYAPRSVGSVSTENVLYMLKAPLESVLRTARPVFLPFAKMVNLGIPERLQSVIDAGIRSLALFPIGDSTRAEAVMIVGSSRSEGFSTKELALLKDLAVHLRIAWQNAQLFKQVKTAYEQLQEAQDRIVQTEKLRALGEMSSGVVHDFNNILAAILGRIQIINRRLSDFEDWSGIKFLEKNLDLIEKAANDGSEILSRISEFTKKRPSEKSVELRLDQIIADAIELTRPKWHDISISRGKTITVNFDRTGNLQTAGSPSELREVFINLINNAVDAIPGDGNIIINAHCANDANIVVTVEDNGQGMSSEVRKKIFEPFFTTKAAEGTGLGLSVTYGIVTRHKGTIEVASEPGVGTKFTISFPIRTPGQDETRSIEVQRETCGNGSILVIDDEDQFREITQEILSSGGHQVESAADGIVALQMLKDKKYDVVITDLGMSGMSGWELADSIHKDFPDTRIIMATGWGSNLDKDDIYRHHVHSLICKPFKIEEILKAVRLAIQDKKNEVLIEQE
jgi:signal transduction histidine kinase/putative methionine-R-sulfoxide reductase with GAF domain/CheY-like chemotaxis protein